MSPAECLVLEGKKGVTEGERFCIDYGQTTTVGRSRVCGICLARLKKYKALSQEKKKNPEILSISRKHLQLSFFNAQCIELKDMSSNGTFLNGKRIKKEIISDIKKRPYDVRLGKRETLTLYWGLASPTAASQEKAVNKPAGPVSQSESKGSDNKKSSNGAKQS